MKRLKEYKGGAMKKKIIWDFKVKKGEIETTNIHFIDFKNGIIKWAWKTDEIHEDKLNDVELYAFLDGVGYVRVSMAGK